MFTRARTDAAQRWELASLLLHDGQHCQKLTAIRTEFHSLLAFVGRFVKAPVLNERASQRQAGIGQVWLNACQLRGMSKELRVSSRTEVFHCELVLD